MKVINNNRKIIHTEIEKKKRQNVLRVANFSEFCIFSGPAIIADNICITNKTRNTIIDIQRIVHMVWVIGSCPRVILIRKPSADG